MLMSPGDVVDAADSDVWGLVFWAAAAAAAGHYQSAKMRRPPQPQHKS